MPPPLPVSLVEQDTFPGQRYVQVRLGSEVVAEVRWYSEGLDATAVEVALRVLAGGVATKDGHLSLLP